MGGRQSAETKSFQNPEAHKMNLRLTEDLVNRLYGDDAKLPPQQASGISPEDLKRKLQEARDFGRKEGMALKEKEFAERASQSELVKIQRIQELEKLEVDRLSKRFEEVEATQKPFHKVVDPVSEEKRAAIIACLSENKTTPLNCSRQVKEFSEAVRKANLENIRID